MRLNDVEIKTLSDLKDTNQIKYAYYLSIAAIIYEDYKEIRLTTGQLASIIFQRYGGDYMKHVRAVGVFCLNGSDKEYVSKIITK